MNAIFGCLSTNDSLATSVNLPRMAEAMARWAADGLFTWLDGSIGLGCAAIHHTPEALGECLPLHDPGPGLTLTAGARLDNRPELLADLRALLDDWHSRATGADQPAPISDALLILLAYQKWGLDCVHHLLGDWHFAVWDAPQQRLFLARDHQGQSGLYVSQGSGWLAFASLKKPLLALPALPQRPNLQRLAEILISQPGDGLQTAYEGITRLPPAHYLTVSLLDLTPRLERYWRLEDTPLMHLQSDETYVEGFLQVFTQAVQARLRCHKPLGVTLSGGLDSGSVAAVAAHLLAERGATLTAYTSIPLTDTTDLTGRRFGDEWALAAETARLYKNIEHLAISAEHISPLAGVEQMLAIHDEPGHAAGNAFWLTAILAATQQRGLGALLTGQGGNATISWTGGDHSLLPWLLAGDGGAFWQAVEREQRAHGLTRSAVLRRMLIKPLIWPLRQRLQAAARRSNPWRMPEWVHYAALRPAIGRQLGLHDTTLQDGNIPFDPLVTRWRIIRPGQNTLGHTWLENGLAYGLEVRDPTFDRQVMAYCLSTPDDQFRADGFDRWLLRRAMQGFLRDAVRLNRRRGRQAADIGYRVLAHASEIQIALDACIAHPLCQQMLDLPRMNAILQSLKGGVRRDNNQQCGTILLRGLGVGLFLLRF